MKRIFSLCIGICTFMTGFAQTDSTKAAPDTIKVGSMTIIREKGSKPEKANCIDCYQSIKSFCGEQRSIGST